MPDELKAQVQHQFGPAADSYATSDVHAKGDSLAALLQLVKPQPDWLALDMATGAGHTALLFAPHVAQVTASDLTDQMLAKTAQLAAQRGFSNVKTRLADAEALPFEANTFDLVTCRLAFHHFPYPRQAVAEVARVLKPGGVFGLADNVTVPDAPAADYYNAYEKLRDPSHYWVHSQAQLETMLAEAGLQVEASSNLIMKELEFHDWADRQRVTPENKEKLLDMMRRIPAALQPLFAPRWAEGTVYFNLWEVVIVARKGAAA